MTQCHLSLSTNGLTSVGVGFPQWSIYHIPLIGVRAERNRGRVFLPVAVVFVQTYRPTISFNTATFHPA